ncbi:uncharacterized protein LOC108457971 [Gossypium arboreum]|uniref:uncharacterized protein LOC108457971 n=1 Tax=Gossypium arboreum TaxID=29729 RepID=UPI0022F15EED|nr:uncharacterized protein LOC108457971 [Gossypium arboreum]
MVGVVCVYIYSLKKRNVFNFHFLLSLLLLHVRLIVCIFTWLVAAEQLRCRHCRYCTEKLQHWKSHDQMILSGLLHTKKFSCVKRGFRFPQLMGLLRLDFIQYLRREGKINAQMCFWCCVCMYGKRMVASPKNCMDGLRCLSAIPKFDNNGGDIREI